MVYFISILCLICPFLIHILQLLQSDLYHDHIDTYYFDFIIFNSSFVHFWIRITQHQIIPQKHTVLQSDFISQNKGDR